MPTATMGRRRVDDIRSAPEAPQPCWSASKRAILLILRDVLVQGEPHGGEAKGLALGSLALGTEPLLAAPVGVV
jgi:hypothetical protein